MPSDRDEAKKCAAAKKRNKEEGNEKVRCNRIDKNASNLNIRLRPREAIRLARSVLKKALILVETGCVGGAVHLWNIGEKNDNIWCGMEGAARADRQPKKNSD